MKLNATKTIQRTNSINAVLLLIFGLAGLWLGAIPANADPVTYSPNFDKMNLKVGGSDGTEDAKDHFSTDLYGNNGLSYSYSITAGSANISVSRNGSIFTVSPVAAGNATIRVTATSAVGIRDDASGDLYVTVLPDNSPPAFTSSASFNAAENQTTVGTVTATDDHDSQDSIKGYSISGGDDSGKFSIDSSSGALTFNTAPDFENPQSSATPKSNTYKVTVQAKSGQSGNTTRDKTATQDITVTVTNVNGDAYNRWINFRSHDKRRRERWQR